ncbi:lysophospholipid acyltransferase family protein [Yoonia litorea]|uniref:Acyltransferase n=1 Tax=Yoonia litorea TaxID=1123755 RepID=A0A1I6MXT7_9RHOB|nr:lysophospholipid acyltransferase family protein [Yoonia litorea]SFS20479.1 Acyltransferase [Yoonia litorea]
MSDMTSKPLIGRGAPDARRTIYNRDALTYSDTFDSAWRRNVIKAIEWCTGKIKVLRVVRQFETQGKLKGQAFWDGALAAMGIDIQTPPEQYAHIPKSGPVIVVANHPHGLVDGMILAQMLGRVRSDYRILTRAFLTDIDEDAGSVMIPVPFPHDVDAQEKMIEMRQKSMAHLEAGGLIALFPSGVVATSKTMFGPMIEADWNVFTAKMIRKSGATVVPLYFPGSNSRWYHMANRISPVLRQSLLIHEIAKAFDKPQKPVIGAPFDADDLSERLKKPREAMAWMREQTLRLREKRR